MVMSTVTLLNTIYRQNIKLTETQCDMYYIFYRVLSIDIFFRTAVLQKLFDIKFSYKHCNFSQVCLLVKMVSKTVTRSIV